MNSIYALRRIEFACPFRSYARIVRIHTYLHVPVCIAKARRILVLEAGFALQKGVNNVLAGNRWETKDIYLLIMHIILIVNATKKRPKLISCFVAEKYPIFYDISINWTPLSVANFVLAELLIRAAFVLANWLTALLD